MKKIYFLEKDGALATEPVITGTTDGNSTEILLASAGVGVFLGYYPARKAASLNSIDAQRYEWEGCIDSCGRSAYHSGQD